MTQVIIQDITPRTQLIASASQTVFNTDWTADVSTDIDVYARADGVDADDITQLVSSSLYNVTFIGVSRTVRVTFLSGRTLNDVITIVRNTPAERLNLYINTNFTPSMLNQDFGILTLVDQQAQMYDTVIAPHYNVSATIEAGSPDPVDVILPILGENQIWAMNPSRTAIIPYDVPEGGGLAPAIAKYLIQTSNPDLPNAQVMGSLASGIVINTSTSGIQITRNLIGTTNQITITNGNGIAGNLTISISDNPKFPGIEGIGIPIGTTGQRPISPVGTSFRYNTTTSSLEYWNGTTWIQIGEEQGVDSLTGTEFQVLVNGTFGTPLNGSLVLTTPQNIATGSSPTFLGLTLTNPLSPANGGTGINNGTSTLTLGGNHTLIGAFASTFTFTNTTGVTFPTSGTLATTSQIPTGAVLSKTDDANVTLTLGGTPNTALVNAASLTLGWTGELSLLRGGTNKNITADNGALVYCDVDSFELLASTAIAGQIPLSGANSAPAWSTATYPDLAGTVGNVLTSDGTNWISSAGGGGGGVTDVQVQHSVFNVGTDTGVADAYVVDLTPALLSYTDGLIVMFEPNNANATTTPTLDVNGLGPVTITMSSNAVTLEPNYLFTNQTAVCVYNAGNNVFLLLTPWLQAEYVTPLQVQHSSFNVGVDTGIADAYIVDLNPASSLVNGLMVGFTAMHNNATTTPTLTVNGATAPIILPDIGALPINAISSSVFILCVYAQSLVSFILLDTSVSSATYFSSNGEFIYNNNGTLFGDTAFTTDGSGNLNTDSLSWNDNTKGLVGTSTNDNAGAGFVGEEIESIIPFASTVTLTNATNTDVTSITLDAGDWDVWGNVNFVFTGFSTDGVGWTSDTSATLPDASLYNAISYISAVSQSPAFSVPTRRYSLTTSTVIYLSVRPEFSTGAGTACGGIYARRRR